MQWKKPMLKGEIPLNWRNTFKLAEYMYIYI